MGGEQIQGDRTDVHRCAPGVPPMVCGFAPGGCSPPQAALFPPAQGVARAAVFPVPTVSGADGSGSCPSKLWR